MDLKERVIIEIDPETGDFAVIWGDGAPVNVQRAYVVLKSIVETIENGDIFEDPGLTVGDGS